MTVAVLADLQFSRVGDHERKAIETAMALKPDIVVLPGDVFQGDDNAFQQHADEVSRLLAPLKAPGGVYLVAGDCDTPERLRQVVRGTNVSFLFNETKRIRVRGLRVVIGGVEVEYDSPASRRTIRRLREASRTADVSLLLSHRPGVVLSLDSPSGVDLVVSGHTHGGQVQIPGIGPLVTASRIPRSAGAGGASVVNGTRLYVSRGVGCERGQAPRLRLFCPPEVSLLRLVSPKVREQASDFLPD